MYNYDGLERKLSESGIKKSQLTEKLGISSRTLAKISRGERLSRIVMEKLGAFFGCDPSELVCEEVSPAAHRTAAVNAQTGVTERSAIKRICIFGGGTGISNILAGLKMFPVDVTAVITVSDDGSSTGVLKEELDIPAVGDLGKVLLTMSNVDEDFLGLLRYRFKKLGSLYNHPVRNIMLAALIDLKGDITEASKYMSKILRVKGTVLPLTEERVELIGYGRDQKYEGEVAVSRNAVNIDYLEYDHPIKVNPDVVDAVLSADLVILSPGSLYTSILPHLIAPAVREALIKTDAPIMYISNLVTQPGETDGYTVGDHVRVLNRYLKDRKIDIVLANTGAADPEVSERYRVTENKYMVRLDSDEVKAQGARLISDDVFRIEKGSIVHDELKTAYMVFSSLMEQK